MLKNLAYITVIILGTIAVVFGLLTYQQYFNPSPNFRESEEKKLLRSVPLQTAPLEERIAFNEKLKGYEQETGTIDVNRCRVSPKIFRVKEGTEFRIRNQEHIPYKIGIGDETFELAPSSIVIRKAGKGDSLTDISCNGGIEGLIHIHQ